MSARDAKSRFHGCYIATLTPFDSDNRLAIGLIQAHTRWLLDQGVVGLCPAGTTGEFLYLTPEEKQRVVEATVEGAAGRAPVIAGIWAQSPEEVRALAQSAEESGADGVFLPTPIYYPAGDESIYAWYANVHQATSLPVFAYNIPQYAANAISISCLRRLFEDGIIAGVKDSTGKLDRVTELVASFGAEHVVFAASDGFASEGRRIGADGFISAIGNAAPALFARLWEGDDSLQPRVDAIRTALKQIGSIPALKYLLSQQGFAFGGSRIPFSDLTADQQADLDLLLPQLGI
jgi:4-hydroxy-tetrahydrodipicolinate synthase